VEFVLGALRTCACIRSISTATASRDLRTGIIEGVLEQRGARRTTE